jgi:ATP-binding protein involved in chromosome partitioning
VPSTPRWPLSTTEIHKPITELEMVRSVVIDGGTVTVDVLLTVPGCPMKDRIIRDVTAAVGAVPGVDDVRVQLGVMTEVAPGTEDPAAAARRTAATSCSTARLDHRIYAVASGKGGVGKSSVTANLAAALAAEGLKVGVVDADIYGFSIPRMLGVEGKPTQLDSGDSAMILPPVSHDVKVISIGMFVPGNQPVVWRGPMLHRALQQFLADVFWGDLDVLLLDLPQVPATSPSPPHSCCPRPGDHGDHPQTARRVAEAGRNHRSADKQQIVGVVSMSWLELPDGTRMDVFAPAVDRWSPIPELRSGPRRCWVSAHRRRSAHRRDGGVPVVISAPASPAAEASRAVARTLSAQGIPWSGVLWA